MATNDMTLISEADFLARAVRITETESTGRRALILPSGATLEVGDTGWIDLSGAVINGWTVTALKARRVGYTVLVQFTGLNGTSATSSYFVKLNTGLAPNEAMDFTFALSNVVRTVWMNNKSLSISPTANVNSTTVAQVTIPVPGLAWPTALGGPKL